MSGVHRTTITFFLVLNFCRTVVAADLPKIVSLQLGSPYISASKMIGNFKATSFSIDCLIFGEATNEKITAETTFLINKKVITSFKDDYPIERVALPESNLRGKIGNNLTCQIVLQHSDGTKSEVYESPPYFLGVYAVDSNGIPIKEVEIKQGDKLSITLRSTFPFTTGHCMDSKHCLVTKAMFDMLHVKSGVVRTHCRLIFSAVNDSLTYESSTVNIAALMTPGVEESTHLMEFREYKSIFRTILIQNYQIPPITVRVVDNVKQKSCHSHGDPHFVTFDDVRFDNYFVGDFDMLSTKHRTFQVQIRQIHCVPNGATCICGVVVREGNSILGVTACDDKPNYLVVEIMKDNTNLPAIIQMEKNKYIIRLISGVRVEAEPFTLYGKKFLNVYVFPLKREKYGGVCSLPSQPSDFNEFRVSSTDTFFSKTLPQCVDEVFTYPACKCISPSKKNFTVVCGFQDETEYASIIKLENVCNTKDAPKLVKREAGSDDSHSFVELKQSDVKPKVDLSDIFGSIDRKKPSNESSTQVNEIKRLIDEETAKEECESKLKASQFYKQCSDIVDGETYKELIKNCIDDVGFSGSFEVIGSVIKTFETTCEIDASKEISIVNGSSTDDGKKYVDVVNTIQNHSCPACANNGTCVDGKCKCPPGFSGKNCAYVSGNPPAINFVRNLSTCDVLADECDLINLEVLVDPDIEEDMKCRADMVLEDGTREKLMMSEKIVQPGFFQCAPDKQAFETARNKRSRMNVKLYTVIKDETKDLKSNEIDLLVYDSTCLSCLNEGCPQKKNTCLIDQICYKAGEAKDVNLVCDPNISPTQWSGAKKSQSVSEKKPAAPATKAAKTIQTIKATTPRAEVQKSTVSDSAKTAVVSKTERVMSPDWIIVFPIVVWVLR